MANLECQHFPDVGNHHAHACSAFARLRLRSCCGTHKWYQHPSVTRIGYLKAVLGVPIGSRRRPPVHRVLPFAMEQPTQLSVGWPTHAWMHQERNVSFRQLRTCLPDWLGQLCAMSRHSHQHDEHREDDERRGNPRISPAVGRSATNRSVRSFGRLSIELHAADLRRASACRPRASR